LVKIRILSIGDHKDKWIADGCDHYVKMLSRWASVEFVAIPSPKSSSRLSPTEIQKAESTRLLGAAGTGQLVALSDSGKEFDSSGFAKVLEKWHTTAGGTICFLVGGPYGHHPDLLAKANVVLSLSPLTFSHQLVRLVLLEQIYRAFTILHGTDYHK
jgi:23S rRNA (pseudouridine1915-N3)-methyltransferase